MKTVKDILGEAVREYNNIMFGDNAPLHKNDTYTERRGIFYNCLRRGFHQVFDFTREIDVDKLYVKFRDDGSLVSFSIDRTPNWGTKAEVVPILTELKQLSNLEYLDTKARIDFKDIENFKFTF